MNIAGVSVREIAEEFGTPIFVYDADRIRENAEHLSSAFTSRYPAVRFHYAIKANPHPAVCALLKNAGWGMDVSSPSELELAQHIGVSPEHILFSGNFLSDDDLRAGVESGAIMNLDDASLLPRLLRFGTPTLLSFCVNPGMGQSNVGHFDVTGGPAAKFGIHPDAAAEAFAQAKAAGIERFGIHMMAGSCVTDYAYFGEITRRILEIMRFNGHSGLLFGSLTVEQVSFPPSSVG